MIIPSTQSGSQPVEEIEDLSQKTAPVYRSGGPPSFPTCRLDEKEWWNWRLTAILPCPAIKGGPHLLYPAGRCWSKCGKLPLDPLPAVFRGCHLLLI